MIQRGTDAGAKKKYNARASFVFGVIVPFFLHFLDSINVLPFPAAQVGMSFFMFAFSLARSNSNLSRPFHFHSIRSLHHFDFLLPACVPALFV